MSVEVVDEQGRTVDVDELARLVRHVLEAQGAPADVELTVMLVDTDTIADLNREHLGKDGPTDVLAFPIDQPGEAPEGTPTVLGDVVLCPEVAAHQASEFDREPADEVRLLTVHGVLHLLGMDHADPEQERLMFGRTDELLASFESAEGDAA